MDKVNEIFEKYHDKATASGQTNCMSIDAFRSALEYWQSSTQSKGEADVVPASTQSEFIIRRFDSDKYYWCKCENCGWEDSSEFTEGCHPIADTGDHSDPLCPVCGCNDLEGDAVINVPDQYSGIIDVKIPFSLVVEPYKKTVKMMDEVIDRFRFPEVATPSLPASTQSGGVETQSINYLLVKKLESLQEALQQIHEMVDSPEYGVYTPEWKIWKICNDAFATPSPLPASTGVQTCKVCGIFVFTPDGKRCMNGHTFEDTHSPNQEEHEAPFKFFKEPIK